MVVSFVDFPCCSCLGSPTRTPYHGRSSACLLEVVGCVTHVGVLLLDFEALFTRVEFSIVA